MVEFTLTRVGPGDASLTFSQLEPLRTTFFESGDAVGVDASASLQVLSSAPTPTPTPTATPANTPVPTPTPTATPVPTPTATPPSGGGGGGGGGFVPSPSPTPTPATRPPDSPENVSATSGDGQATVQWAPSPNDGGSPVTAYVVLTAPGGLTLTVSAAETSAVVTGLTNGVSYVFQVAARNSAGLSFASSPTAPVTPVGPPTAPLNATASPGSSGDAAVVSWDAPASDGGSPLTGYLVAADPPDVPEVAVGAAGQSATVPGLLPGIAYTFTVRAVNAIGTGGTSEASPPITLTPPPTPTPTPSPTPTVTPAPGPTPILPAGEAPASTSVFDTTIAVGDEDRAVLEQSLSEALGAAAQVTDAPITVASSDGRVFVSLPIEVAGADQPFTADLDVQIDGLDIETSGGAGTVSVQLSPGLAIEGSIQLVTENQAVVAELANPELVYTPPAPPPVEGSAFSHTSVEFRVGITDVPDGASLTVTYARSAEEVAGIAGAVFELGATGGQTTDPEVDIAFAVNVVKSGIGNESLGSNTMTMTVDRTWYEDRVAEGKTIVITKVSEDGARYTAEATCEVDGDLVRCSVLFDGAAGGFSLFALVAVARAEAPPAAETPEQTVVPTAPPATVEPATPGPTPEPTLAPTVPPALPSPVPTPTPETGALVVGGSEVDTTPTPTAIPKATPTPRPTPLPLPTFSAGGQGQPEAGQAGGSGGFPWWVLLVLGAVAAPVLVRVSMTLFEINRRGREVT